MDELISIGTVSFEESFKDDLAVRVCCDVLDEHVSSLVFPRLVLNINTVDRSDEFIKVIGIRDSDYFLLLSKFWSHEPFKKSDEFVMMFGLMKLHVLNHSNSSRDPESSEHVQYRISYLIKSSSRFMRIQVHPLRICRFAG